MAIKKNDLIAIANLHLNELINNNTNDSLDLPIDFGQLNCDWDVVYKKSSQYSIYPVYRVTGILKNKECFVAKYIVIFTEKLEFIDEFFITYQ